MSSIKKDMICDTVENHGLTTFGCEYPILVVLHFLFFSVRPSNPDDSSTEYEEQSIYTDYIPEECDEYENVPFRLRPDTESKGFI